MLIRAWVQKEKRSEYESAAWQPEPELGQPPPRSVSISPSFKLVGVLILFVVGIMVCLVCLPSLKHAYLTRFGVSTKATILQRYSRANPRSHSYYLLIRYETPSGNQLVRIQTSRNYYSGSLQSTSVPVHYLAQIPSQVVLDDDQLFPPWQALLVLAYGVAMLWLVYYMYRKIRTIAENGTALKGIITKTNNRLKNLYLTVYYEFQGVPYQGTIAVRAREARADWQAGKAITLLVAPAPPSSAHRPHVAMVYPAREFKVNL
jgi:hypothetical protein